MKKLILYSFLFFSLLNCSCSNDSVEINNVDVIYEIDDTYTPYFVVYFSSNVDDRKNNFSVNVYNDIFKWSSECNQTVTGTSVYNFSNPFVIPMIFDSTMELNIDISHNNDKIKKNIKIINPLYSLYKSYIKENEELSIVDSENNKESNIDVDVNALEDKSKDEKSQDENNLGEKSQDENTQDAQDVSTQSEKEQSESAQNAEDAGSAGSASDGEDTKNGANKTYEIDLDKLSDMFSKLSCIFSANIFKISSSRIAINIKKFKTGSNVSYGYMNDKGGLMSSSTVFSNNFRSAYPQGAKKMVLSERYFGSYLSEELYFIKKFSL